MTYFRQRRVDLGKFDSRWGENAYILIGTQTYRQIQALNNEQQGFNRKQYRLSKEIEKLEKDINDSESLEIVLDQIDDKKIQLSKIVNDQMDFMIRTVKENFISGFVYDPSIEGDNKIRPATKDDIESFDVEIMNELVSAVLGNIEKKG